MSIPGFHPGYEYYEYARRVRSAEARPILAGALGFVQGLVGSLERVFDAFARSVRGDARRKRDEDLLVFVHEQAAAQRSLQPRQDHLAFFDGRVGQEDDKFFTAVTRRQIGRAQGAAHYGGE